MGGDEQTTGQAASSTGEGLAALLAQPRRLVSPRARAWWLTRVVLRSVVLLAVVGAWWWFDDQRRTLAAVAWLVLLAACVAAAVVEPVWRYRVHRWDHTADAVLTRSGWLTQERRVAPISRVQTVDLERGPLAQLFGLATVTVTTASAKGPVRIEGLDLATAEQVVQHLTVVTSRVAGDAT